MNKTNNDRAANLKKQIIKQGIGRPDLIKGCSEPEISKLEQKYNVIFPQSYKIFLKNFGHGLGGVIMKECDILYNDAFELTNVLRNEILIEEGDPVLPDKAFVFAGRYNEQFMFFDASGLIEEPPIFLYMIDEKDFSKIGNSVFDVFNI
ncbi:MAG: SMI1/KNR4 family protein [Cyanobacteria bacterium P01_G01_bin.39]